MRHAPTPQLLRALAPLGISLCLAVFALLLPSRGASAEGEGPDLRKAAAAAAAQRAALPPASASGSPASAPVSAPVSAPASAPTSSPTTSPSVLYPPRRDVLVFSHARHEARGATCDRCHPAATTSRSSVDLLLPTEAACRACHAIDRAAPTTASCGACHRGFSPSAVVPRVSSEPPALKFSHAAHAKTNCRQCHASVDDRPALPSMASCLGCHRDASSRCTTCHLATPSGRVDVSLSGWLGASPSGTAADALSARLRPRSNLFGDAHDAAFATNHRAAAARSDRTCASCHDESYCADCHAGTVRPLDYHPADYLQAHALEARRAASECSTCHRQQSFCVGCHERTGVAPRAASELDRTSAPFHPASWASVERGAAQNLHAVSARRNLTTCTSCHRESDCLPCHSADSSGLRISPHPRAWRSSAQCRALDRANRRMCTRCHVTDDEQGCDWSAD